MDLSKSLEFFNPIAIQGKIHIIGCGSVGSTLAELLARMGFENFVLYDFDKVEAHNIANQMFFAGDIGKNKAAMTAELITAINPDTLKVKVYEEGYTNQKLSGYVFLCVDSIELRKKIAVDNKDNLSIKAMFDFRTRLTDAQHYACEWDDPKKIDAFISTMDFSSEEAKDSTPVSACGVVLGVAPTVRDVCNVGACNFINYLRKGKLQNIILVNTFDFNNVLIPF